MVKNSLRASLFPCLFLASPGLAWDACDDLWFARNFEFDQVGYCFKSPLGRQTFPGDCAGQKDDLSPGAKSRIAQIKTREADLGCRVDSQRQTLDIEGQRQRHLFPLQPIANGGESMCIGWLGGVKDLFPADLLRKNEMAIGQIHPGDDIMFRYDNSGDFTFVQIYRDGQFLSQGWTLLHLRGDQCRDLAG